MLQEHFARTRSTALLAAAAGVLSTACSTSGGGLRPASSAPPAVASGAAARADSVRASFTKADVDFMTGMIHHHAQALVMARMAPSHGASPTIQLLCERIINGQDGEIGLMQRWLRDRGLPTPEPSVMAGGDTMGASAMDPAMHAGQHTVHMPGMLTSDQMVDLDEARGPEFDRLFLTFMIQHHRGALTMVDELFAAPGAALGDQAFRLASGIAADQSSEIDRMQSMLHDLMFGPGGST